MRTKVELGLWECRRLLQLFDNESQQVEDKDLWLKLRDAELKLLKRARAAEKQAP